MKLAELKKELSKLDIPKEVQLDKHTHITDTKKFIESNIEFLENNPGVKGYLPYYNRLLKLYNIIKNG